MVEVLEAVGGGLGVVTIPITGGAGGCTWAPYLFVFRLTALVPGVWLLPTLGNGLRPSSRNASASASSSSEPDTGGDGKATWFVVYRGLLCCVGSRI